MSRRPLLLAVDLYPDGGGISAIVENSLELLRADYDVHVVIVDEREGRRDALRLPESRVHVYGSRPFLKPYLAPLSLVYSLRIGWFLRRLVRQIRPAALLVQDGLFLPVPGLIATRASPTKLAVMDHGTLTNSRDPAWQKMFPSQLPFPKSIVYRLGFWFDGPWRALRWRLGFGRADAVWYVGEEMKPLLGPAQDRARQYRQPAPRDFRPPTRRQRAHSRRLLHVAEDQVVVNMVSRLAGEKGLPQVLDAVERVNAHHPKLRLLVAGWGPQEAWFRAEVERRSLASTISLLGQLDRSRVQNLQHASDFHLYAGTIGCGMSLALLEAMACGVVPIVSDVPRQHRELARPAGWVFSAGDADALAKALTEAVSCEDQDLEWRRDRARADLQAYSSPSVADLLADLLQGR